MRVTAIALLVSSLILAGCDGGQAAVDIVSAGRAQSPAMLPPPTTVGPISIALDVDVRAGQLRSLLDRRGSVDLAVFECAAPDGPSESAPLYFGGEAITGLIGSQVSDDPEMLVRLNAAVPQSVASLARPCARLVGRPGLMAPEVISRPVPLALD